MPKTRSSSNIQRGGRTSKVDKKELKKKEPEKPGPKKQNVTKEAREIARCRGSAKYPEGAACFCNRHFQHMICFNCQDERVTQVGCNVLYVSELDVL